jgi:fibronectin type 3 domain-containing protein
VRITLQNGTDTTPPGPVSGLAVTRTAGGLRFSWNAASDDSGAVQHYVVTRNSAPLADVYTTTALDPVPIPGRTSTYVVTPIDPAGNAGTPSTIQVAVSDATRPSAPTDLAASITGAGVRLTWTPATDDVAVASYEVDRDGQPLITGLQTTTYVDQAPAGSHVYTVRATDTAGNVGPFAGPLGVVVVGPASIPTPIVVKVRLKVLALLELKRVGKHKALLTWKAQKGVHRYQVLRAATSKKKKPVLIATVKRTRYTDTRAPVGALQKKRYVVRAVVPS